MEKKKVELLAPAGNYQALTGAINAGADAVYLGGDRFSARAYADNFTTEEILRALRYTHFSGRKLYLTLNTLIKEEEFAALHDFVEPFYEYGLDGIIIQDLGVFNYIKETFPGLPLHVSTQMTVTGVMGASFLEKNGASRLVPARELSHKEIVKIKESTGLELECFIHGAMCYCYSGQCLFSSILGGRSGNRGRCAQPCRLSYSVLDADKSYLLKDSYPLSLKDMCTIECIPKLIEAGIDSFKIEGRMKSPEYAAGVTAIYRKYIDRYYESGVNKYHVKPQDMDKLKKLYIRSELQTGYYERINGREMVTLNKPGYIGSDEELIKDIANKYLQGEQKYPVAMHGTFNVGKRAELKIEGLGITQTSSGDIVQKAINKPMDKEQFIKQLQKTGSSYIYAETIDVEIEGDAFMPIAQLNKLRRESVEAFEDKVISSRTAPYKEKSYVDNCETIACSHEFSLNEQNKGRLTAFQALEPRFCSFRLNSYHENETTQLHENNHERQMVAGQSQADIDLNQPRLHVSIRSMEQLEVVSTYSCTSSFSGANSRDCVCERLYIDSDLYIKNSDRISQRRELYENFEIYLALPYIIREKDAEYLQKLQSLIHNGIKGFLVRNLESLFWVFSLKGSYDIVTDTGIYCFNAETVKFLSAYSSESYLPYELNEKECRKLIENYNAAVQQDCSRQDVYNIASVNHGHKISMTAYGTIPMMITANCLEKTTVSCHKKDCGHLLYLNDRYNKKFPVFCNCEHCYNIIYNSVPYSLHANKDKLYKFGLYAIRLDFVSESGDKVKEILDFYSGNKDSFPVAEYTTGHYKRGIE
ncbi:MAG: U32 family peptidase [Butyrivibrio sp.]|nr:U32 family peptidase [Butyrivibrio sp.]